MQPNPQVLLPHILLLTILVATPAMALPIIFTDRAAFEAYVGDYTLLTLDAPQIVMGTPDGDGAPFTTHVTYNNLMTFSFDYLGGLGNTNPLTLGSSSLLGFGVTMQPVTAFGFDVVGVGSIFDHPTAQAFANVNGIEFALTSGMFIGLVSSTPFVGTVATGGGGIYVPFLIDNISLQTVPEVSTLFLLACGLALVAGWRWKQRAQLGGM